jgi:hypothetical protein
MLPHPHPDETADWKEYKKIKVGAHQAIEDQAIKNYHAVFDNGGSSAEAEAKYFETFNKSYGKVNS